MLQACRLAGRLCLAALTLIVTVPERTSPAAQRVPRRVPVNVAANPISTLFAALSVCRDALPERDRWRIAGVIHQQSQRYGYDPLFVLALIEVESSCVPEARGRQGAVGLIQVKPSTAQAMADDAGVRWHGPASLTRPLVNVQLGLHYLAHLERRFRDPRVAIAAYNLGPRRVSRMPRYRARRTTYVRKVLARYDALLLEHTDTPPRVS